MTYTKGEIERRGHL